MMDNQELKDFIGLAMTDLKINLNRLSDSVDSLRNNIRNIEITTTTRIAEIQKEVDNNRRDIVEIRDVVKDMGDSQKFNWKELNKQQQAEREEQAKKWEMQSIINEGNKQVRAVLYAIFLLVLSLVGGFIWQMIVNGGVRGITVP